MRWYLFVLQEDHKGSANKRKSTKKLDIYMLDHYYALLSDTQKILKEYVLRPKIKQDIVKYYLMQQNLVPFL